jgi:hypothetical protein
MYSESIAPLRLRLLRAALYWPTDLRVVHPSTDSNPIVADTLRPEESHLWRQAEETHEPSRVASEIRRTGMSNVKNTNREGSLTRAGDRHQVT